MSLDQPTAALSEIWAFPVDVRAAVALRFSGLILPVGLRLYLETIAKLLKLLEGVLGLFSKCALKSLNNQADFDSAIPRFES
jgi:hypothetical protein